MEKQNKQMRLIDCAFVYMLCLLQMGLLGSLLIPKFGVWGILLCELVTVVIVLFTASRNRLKRATYLPFSLPSMGEIFGGAFLYTATLLVVIPLLMFGCLLFPGFAESAFHILDCKYSSVGMILLLCLGAGGSETLLWEGYMASGFRCISHGILRMLVFAGLSAIYRLDLYLLLPIGIMEGTIYLIRDRSNSVFLPFVLHVLTVLLSVSLMQASSGFASMIVETGTRQTIGLAFIFWGASIPVWLLGNFCLKGRKKSTPFLNVILLIAAIVLIAFGCGISGME